jgi:hypothetical protein
MSISFAPARCREWSFRLLGGEWHLLRASRGSHGRLPPQVNSAMMAGAWVPSAIGRSQLPAQAIAVHISAAPASRGAERCT